MEREEQRQRKLECAFEKLLIRTGTEQTMLGSDNREPTGNRKSQSPVTPLAFPTQLDVAPAPPPPPPLPPPSPPPPPEEADLPSHDMPASSPCDHREGGGGDASSGTVAAGEQL